MNKTTHTTATQLYSRLKAALIVAAMSLVLVVGVMAPPASAASGGRCSAGLLTFPAWYSYVNTGCDEVKITQLNDLWIIALNFVEILIQAVAYAAVGYLIWGGFKYIKSHGEPGAIQQAKSAIMNAVIGLAASLSAVAIVNFISAGIAGNTTTRFGLPRVSAGALQLDSIMNTVVFPIAGAVAVIFVIIGGYQYVTSNGNSSETTKARNTVLYSVVGLVVIIMAFAIVQLILGRFSG